MLRTQVRETRYFSVHIYMYITIGPRAMFTGEIVFYMRTSGVSWKGARTRTGSEEAVTGYWFPFRI